MKLLLLALLLLPPLSYGDTLITAESLRRGGVEVTGYQLRLSPVFENCLYFEPNDTNQDGVLDVICKGVQYDPCLYGSVSQGYTDFFNSGGVCQNDCPDLTVSPAPPGCRQ
jgi:hypothetical protein